MQLEGELEGEMWKGGSKQVRFNKRHTLIKSTHLQQPGIEFDETQTAHTITFLRRVGLGFTQALRDGIASDMPEDGLDVGRIASLALDLDI